jgi:hypothetical protein
MEKLELGIWLLKMGERERYPEMSTGHKCKFTIPKPYTYQNI